MKVTAYLTTKKGVSAIFGSLYIAFNYFMPVFIVFWGEGYATEIGRFLSLILILFFGTKNNAIKEIREYFSFVLGLMVVVAISAFMPLLFGFYLDYELFLLSSVYEISSLLFIYIVFATMAKNDLSASRVFLVTFFICASINCAVAIYGSYSGNNLLEGTNYDFGVGAFGFDQGTGRSGGFRGENYVGLWSAPVISILCFWIYQGHYRFLGIALLIAVAYSVIISISRTSILTLIVILFFWGIFVIFKRITFVTLTLFIIFVFLSYWFGSLALEHYLSTLSDKILQQENDRLSTDSRTYVWIYWLDIAANSFFIGTGPGSIQEILNFSAVDEIPHNSLISILVEYGFMGIILYMMPWWIAFNTAKDLLVHKVRDIELVIWVATSLGMFVTLMFVSNPLMKIVFVVLACIQGRSQLVSKSRNIRYHE